MSSLLALCVGGRSHVVSMFTAGRRDFFQDLLLQDRGGGGTSSVSAIFHRPVTFSNKLWC